MEDSNCVSIIIPTYSRSENLIRAIDSALNQNYKNIEVIVVDDNGHGTKEQLRTKEKIKKFIEDKRVKYIVREVNGGGGAARNTGIEHASGKYITFLDDDDEYLFNKVSAQVSAIKSGYDIVLCSMKVKNERGIFINANWRVARGNSVKDFLIHGNSYTPMIMVKKELIENGRRFLEVKMLQDHIFVLNMMLGNPELKITALNEELFIHNIHSEERVSRNKDISCFLLKNKMEEQLSFSLSRAENKELLLKQQREIGVLYSEKRQWIKSLIIFTPAIKLVASKESLMLFIKTELRLLLGAKIYSSLKKG